MWRFGSRENGSYFVWTHVNNTAHGNALCLYRSRQKYISITAWNGWTSLTSAFVTAYERPNIKPLCFRPRVSSCSLFHHGTAWNFQGNPTLIIFSLNQIISSSFSSIVSWMLRNTADESDCRGVLITQKLQTCLLFPKTTSCENQSYSPTTTQVNFWNHTVKGKTLKKMHKTVQRRKKNKRALEGFQSPVVLQMQKQDCPTS